MDNLNVLSTRTSIDRHHYLRLKLGDQLVLIGLSHVHLILPILELQTIPHDDPNLAGMLNYHGQPVPVYHLAELIQAPKQQYNLNTLLLLSPLSQGLVGFLACEEMDIIDLSENEIQKPPLNKNRPYVEGLIENKTWSAWILDLEKLIHA